MQQAGRRLSAGGGRGGGGQAVPYGDAVVQTQECTHVSEQLLAVEEGAQPRQAGWLQSVRTYLDAD